VQWHEAIGDLTLANVILDLLVHNANRIQLKGKSSRKNSGETRNTWRAVESIPTPYYADYAELHFQAKQLAEGRCQWLMLLCSDLVRPWPT